MKFTNVVISLYTTWAPTISYKINANGDINLASRVLRDAPEIVHIQPK